MQIQISDSKVKLTDKQKDYVTEKIESLKKYAERISDEASKAKVELSSKRMRSKGFSVSCQVTMSVPRAIIRAEVDGSNVEEAIDLAEDKLRKQIEKYKGKLNRRERKGGIAEISTLERLADSQDDFAVPPARIIRRKKFDQLKPMHEEEAIDQMDLLGHSFFAFWNIDTDKFSVAYKRREDSTYGLIELDKDVAVQM